MLYHPAPGWGITPTLQIGLKSNRAGFFYPTALYVEVSLRLRCWYGNSWLLCLISISQNEMLYHPAPGWGNAPTLQNGLKSTRTGFFYPTALYIEVSLRLRCWYGNSLENSMAVMFHINFKKRDHLS
jgi:hypothetical protein